MNCPICSNLSVPIQGYKKVFLHKCSGCGVRFCGQQPTPEHLSELYSKGYDLTSYFSPITKKRYEELLDEIEVYRQTGKILDIGCGYGFFLDVALEKKWEVFGTEISDKAKKVLQSKGIPLLDSLEKIEDLSLDAVILIETIEHLIDPKATLELVYRKLRKGGIVYITTPNFNSLNRRRFGSNYDLIKFPMHLFYFNKNSLNHLLNQVGFSKISLVSDGISFTHQLTSKKKSNQEFVSETSNDEMLRYRIEKSGFLRLLKRSTNFFLNLLELGEGLKAKYIKK